MTEKINMNEMSLPITACEELEKGNILYFSKIPFSFPNESLAFLLNQNQGSSKHRKNIAYKPTLDRVTNHKTESEEEKEKLHQILKSFSDEAFMYIKRLLEPYSQYIRRDYASFRPFQEKGRDLRLRARNDLLHVDAFPTRPLNGARILRFFININPEESRKWATTIPFKELLKKYGGTNKLAFPKGVSYSVLSRLQRFAKSRLKGSLRSPYDQFMLNMHHFMKENEALQKGDKTFWEFPPGSCWACFTDAVSHAALSGQYALEQTFIVDQKGLIRPEESPARLLELATKKQMIFS